MPNELGMSGFRHGNPPLGLPNAVVGFWGPVGGNCRGAVPVFVVDTEAKGGLRARLGNTVGIVTLFGKEHA